MKKTFLLLLLSSTLTAFAQDSLSVDPPNWLRRTANRIFGDSVPPGKPQFLVYPTIAYAPETSFEIGFSAVTLFYAKGDYLNNRLSEVQLFSFITLQNQYGLWFDHAVYGDEDKWFSLGKIRQQRFPLLYFGMGPEAREEDATIIDASYTLARERLLRKLVPNLFLGLEVDFQRLYNVEVGASDLATPPGADGALNLGLGLGLIYDNRHNVLNVRDGFFAELAWLNYRPEWGSGWNFQTLFADARAFFPISADEKQVLALQGIGTFVRGEAPFNQLALLGGEQMMRGYYLGRFRDQQHVALQAEYRFLPFPFSKRLGGAGFVAAGMVAPELGAFSLAEIKPSAGVGLRYLLFPKKDIFVRLDVGFTPEGPGFYFFTGEAF
jgi:hypothetical protein